MKRSVLVLGLAAILAVVGVVSTLYYVRQADARALAGKRAVTVLIADQGVPAGTTARSAEAAGLFRVERMPAESVPADALDQITSDVAPLVAGADIQPGQLVLRSMFSAEKPASNGLPIPAGKVAVTVEVGATQQVAGYVRAGSKVAVFDTYTQADNRETPTGDGLPKQRKDIQITRLLVPEVEVLAVGPASVAAQNGEESTSDGAAEAASSVLLTVAVEQAEAERLILRANTGLLHLALLTDDSRIVPGAGVDTHSLFRSTKKGD